MTPDVNVLVAASRVDHPHHAPAANWVKQAVFQEEFALLPMVATSFVRIVTNPKIFPRPTPPDIALRFINTLLDATDRALLPLAAEWETFCELIDGRALKANLVTDAWIAAAVIAQDEHLVTFDRDFRKLLKRSQVTIIAA